MFEHSSKPPVFFLHNLKYIGTESHCLAHLFHKCYLQPLWHSVVTKNDISPFSTIPILIQLLVCNDLKFFSQSLFSIPWTLFTFFVLTYNTTLCLNKCSGKLYQVIYIRLLLFVVFLESYKHYMLLIQTNCTVSLHLNSLL